MSKRNLKRDYRELYFASAKRVTEVEVPAFWYLMIDGEGDPNHSLTYSQARCPELGGLGAAEGWDPSRLQRRSSVGGSFAFRALASERGRLLPAFEDALARYLTATRVS